jgi:hypothetical protein
VERARPTLRCLHDDLKVATPSADVPLDEINHPLLAKTQAQFADPATPHERIAAIDDEVFFKVKIQRWRGAVWTDHPSADVPIWLVAAGWREDVLPPTSTRRWQPAREPPDPAATPGVPGP